MATIKDTVRSFLKSAQDIFSPSRIADTLGLNRNTIRRVMQELKREGVVDKPQRGLYVYKPEVAHVYKFVGFKDGEKITSTFTTDHLLSDREIERLYKELPDGEQGNVSLIAEGESTDYDESMIDSWDVMHEDYE